MSIRQLVLAISASMLIDLHVHALVGVSHYGIPPDPSCLARGVTTAVDAGSAGADTARALQTIEAHLDVILGVKVRLRVRGAHRWTT